MKRLILLFVAIALTACASPEYAQYTAAQSSIATARANSETARFNALASIAKDGTDSARVAAVMALALGQSSSGAQNVIQAPQRSDALQWASIIIPGLTQAYAIGKSADVAINSSNNAMLTSTATTAGFVGIAGKIQAPAAASVIVPQANVSTVTTTDSHNTDSHNTAIADSYNPVSGSYNPVTTTDRHDSVSTPVVVPDTIQIVPVFEPVTP